ncbi:MAG: hypothetical protein JST51_10710 [Armatimonadetes bacterium]|nr:hypothetical protein [Armatimonadota bacterium]
MGLATPYEACEYLVRTHMQPIPQRERVLAAAVNVAAIFFPYMGPIVGLVVAARSPYVKFHAFRALIEQVVATVVIGLLIVASLAYSVYSIRESMADGFDLSKINWVALLVKSLATWILLGLWEAVNVVLSIRDALEALRGDVPSKPKWSERRAIRMAGLVPGEGSLR